MGIAEGDEEQRVQQDDDRMYEALANAYYSRFIAGPDIWRSRASTAAGFLATAAAALLAGLLLGENAPGPATKVVGVMCFVSYVGAVALFFRGSVAVAPKVEAGAMESRRDWVAFVTRQITDDLASVKRASRWGAKLAVGSLVLTIATFTLAMVVEPSPRAARVVLSSKGLQKMQQVCRNARATIDAEVASVTADTIRLTPTDRCAGIGETDLRRDLVAVVTYL